MLYSTGESSLRGSAFSSDPVVASTAGARFRPERRDSGFAINGRFLAQPMIGVQRYAHEIVKALDTLLSRQAAEIVTPPETSQSLPLQRIRPARIGAGTGHLWEQIWLPRCGKPLLNLCNTAPLLGWNRCVCIHDANVFDAPDSYDPRFRLAYRALHPLIARSAMTLTTVSRHSAERIAHHLGLPRDRIVIAQNGHEHACRWQPERSTIVHEDHRPYILLLGSLAPHKNIRRILGLAEAVETFGLDIKIVGAAASAFRRQQQYARRNVEFLGSVEDDDLAALFQGALCLAFPSLSEGFGLPMLEAMVWDCPIVASRAGSLPEVGGDACLLADPGSDADWLAHLEALCRSPGLRDDLRGRGRERAKRFSWIASASRYLEIMTSSTGLPDHRRAA